MPRVVINNEAFHLDPAQLIQAGGEGMVFVWRDQAVKLYHRPEPRHRAKLRFWRDSGLAARLPPHVLSPQLLVHDDRGSIAGFAMARLPAGAEPLRRLTQLRYCQEQRIHVPGVLQLLQTAQDTLGWLHRQQIVVGDLSDSNLFFMPPALPAGPVFWLDSDSYQLPGHPCPVATAAFVDPCLFDIPGTFGEGEYFTRATDWYAFAVLLVKSLLHVHPYGGVHHRHQSLIARARAGISLFAPGVRYPDRARPPETLPDAALHQIEQIFGHGARPVGAPILTAALASGWQTCPGCGLSYSQERRGCPACRQTSPVPAAKAIDENRARRLWQGSAQLLHVFARPNRTRIQIITRDEAGYTWQELGPGGPVRSLRLFDSQALYDFAAFGHFLAVNPIGSAQLLLLDISGAQPRQVTLTETGRLNDRPVFAATANYLFRLAGGYLMRGEIRHGHFVESVIGDVRPNQTEIWGAAGSNHIAGYYRMLAEQHFFLGGDKGAILPIAPPSTAPGAALRGLQAHFSPDGVALTRLLLQAGEPRLQIHWFTLTGQPAGTWQAPLPPTADPDLTSFALAGVALVAATDRGLHAYLPTGAGHDIPTTAPVAAGDHLHAHPAGLLLQRATELWLIP